jgi:preprotein translocase SecF subunit
MPQFFAKTNFKFIAYRWYAITVSSIIIVAGLVTMIIRGPNWSIDFRGGIDMQVRFAQPVREGQVREALGGMEVGEVKRISALGRADEILIRMKASENTSQLQNDIRRNLEQAFPGNEIEIRNVDIVGPKVGRELRQSALISGIVAIVLLLIYISWRFKLEFAVGGIIALLHNVLITIAFLAFFNIELSLTVLAAMLTLVGYSINDSVVVFDRIRENLKKLRQMSMGDLIDLSINETLSRSVITSVTVFLTVLALWLFGGEVLRGFSFVMVVGVAAASYATVFIAAPVILEWTQQTAIKGKKR